MDNFWSYLLRDKLTNDGENRTPTKSGRDNCCEQKETQAYLSSKK